MAQKFAAYAKLLRLSNGPTAVADVWMGYAVGASKLEPTLPLALVTLVSLCLYHGGMVLNDANDAEEDALDNRGRPIELGLVTRKLAYRVTIALFALAIGIASIASVILESPDSLIVSLLLACLVYIYNRRDLHEGMGPIFMGGCRFLNVGLGASAALTDGALTPLTRCVMTGIGIYVAGLTVFAKEEANPIEATQPFSWLTGRTRLTLGMLISLAGIAWLSIVGSLVSQTNAGRLFQLIIAWGVVALFAVRGMVAAILQPTPRNIGRGVGIAIQGLVVIDATLATLYAGPVAGLAILALLPVTMLLSRWIPQT